MFKKEEKFSNVKKYVHQIYRKRYGLFWRFHRNAIALDELSEQLKKTNENLMEVSRHIKNKMKHKNKIISICRGD